MYGWPADSGGDKVLLGVWGFSVVEDVKSLTKKVDPLVVRGL